MIIFTHYRLFRVGMQSSVVKLLELSFSKLIVVKHGFDSASRKRSTLGP